MYVEFSLETRRVVLDEVTRRAGNTRSGKQIKVPRMKQIPVERERGRDRIKFHLGLVAGRRADRFHASRLSDKVQL